MAFAQLVLDDLDGLLEQVRRSVADPAVAAAIVDTIEGLHGDYRGRLRHDLAASDWPLAP